MTITICAPEALKRFRVDTQKFTQWWAQEGADLTAPVWTDPDGGAQLGSLFFDAAYGEVVIGDPRLAVTVFGDDDADSSGYTVVVSNKNAYMAPGLTPGWQEMPRLTEETCTRDRIRIYLEDICHAANRVLDTLNYADSAGDVPATAAGWVLAVFHEADMSDRRGPIEPAVTTWNSRQAAIGELRNAFAPELAEEPKGVSDDELLWWLMQRGIHASITTIPTPRQAPPVAGVRVVAWPAQLDDATVVQVDTTADAGRVRININDGPVYDGHPEEDAPPGRFY